MKKVVFSFLFSALFILAPIEVLAEKVITHCMQGDKSYTVDLLKLALNTQKYVYELERNDWFCSEKRKLKSVFERDIKIIWAGASVELEEKLIPVRIPIFKGLTSYRVLLIRRSEQVKFSKIQTLSDFKLLSLGQAEDWVDTKIFRASGIRVVTSHSFEVLPKMLSHGRFDAFPRGIQQAWNDAQQFSNLGLEVEQELAFHYRLPSYFYLSPDSADLAKTLEKGLEALIASGEFDRFFYSHPLIIEGLRNFNIKQRRVFELPNPFLPTKVPTEREELWLNF